VVGPVPELASRDFGRCSVCSCEVRSAFCETKGRDEERLTLHHLGPNKVGKSEIWESVANE
jgi:hypothetical protein